MKIGIGLPTTIPGVQGSLLLDWARAGEEAGFASLATIDRLVYPSYESMVALSAAAAVTTRVELLTNILVAPTRNPVVLAKQAASIDQISGGRLTMGLGIGARPDDYVAAEQDFGTRGRRFDAILETLHGIWEGEGIVDSTHAASPTPVQGRVPILVGGGADVAIARIVRWGVGWTISGAAADVARAAIPKVREAWTAGGHPGEPRIVVLGYYAIGDDADVDALRDYYGFLGPVADTIAEAAVRSAAQAREVVAEWDEMGVDEYVFNPVFADLTQVERLARAVLT